MGLLNSSNSVNNGLDNCSGLSIGVSREEINITIVVRI